jgi:hypothetical protein
VIAIALLHRSFTGGGPYCTVTVWMQVLERPQQSVARQSRLWIIRQSAPL